VFVGLGAVSVVGIHLGLLRRWRHLQMRAILDHVGPAAGRTVIAGDFNEWSDLRGCEPWEKDFTILYPGPTFPTLRPVASLDAMAYGSEISIEEHGVMRTAAARVASDHFPIWATIRHGPR
jgi:endonuclease/exonuclease/phosphatase family metal-dependent hydrolase